VGIGRWCSQRTCFRRPRPQRHGRKQKRATLASTHWKGCWGLSFSTAKARRGRRPQKSRYTSITLACRTGRPPSRNGRVGTKVKEPHHHHFTAGLTPNDCRPRKRHVWGTRQSRWFRGPAALLCELSFFVLAVTSRKIKMQSDAGASDITRPVIVPHTAKRRKLSLGGMPGFLFWRTA